MAVLWFFGKLLVFIFVFIWLRGTLPRLRYDQFMRLGWKVLIPVALVWIVLVAARARAAQRGHARHPARCSSPVGVVAGRADRA